MIGETPCSSKIHDNRSARMLKSLGADYDLMAGSCQCRISCSRTWLRGGSLLDILVRDENHSLCRLWLRVYLGQV